jgi:hypothetical protein
MIATRTAFACEDAEAETGITIAATAATANAAVFQLRRLSLLIW